VSGRALLPDAVRDRFLYVRSNKGGQDLAIFPQDAKQQMLIVDTRRAELAGLVSGEEDHTPCLLCEALEHDEPPLYE
jgi:hypothetical protein